MESISTELTSDSFKALWGRARRLVANEWPDIDADALAATEGELDRVVALVAKTADRTKVWARSRLEEIYEAARAESGRNGKSNGVASEGETDKSKRPRTEQVDELLVAIKRFEGFALEEAKKMSGKMIPAAEEKAKKNLWLSLALALGLGFFFGLWLRGGRSSR